jgi:hypothetical protein
MTFKKLYMHFSVSLSVKDKQIVYNMLNYVISKVNHTPGELYNVARLYYLLHNSLNIS